MKKFIFQIAFFGLFCAILSSAIAVPIDPYNVFHAAAIRDNGIEPNKNYIKMKYILEHPDEFDSYIFGSSRVGALHPEKMEGLHCYNMTYSMGLPQDHLKNIRTMVKHGVCPKRIYIGVDSISYTMDKDIHKKFLYQYPYEKSIRNPLGFWIPYLDVSMVLDSMKTMSQYQKKENFTDIFYQYGWSVDYGSPKNTDYLAEGPFIGTDDYMDEVLQAISDIKQICEENQMELVLFINPMHHLTYEVSVEANWYVFLKRLSEITDYYNFSGLNEVTTDDYCYVDTSHYIGEVGDLMIERMLSRTDTQERYGESFGYYVTKENCDGLLKILTDEWAGL